MSLSDRVQQLRRKLEQRKGQKYELERRIEDGETAVKELKREARRHEQAREIVKKVGVETQRQLSYQIGDITSLALEAVFDDPYELVVDFVQRRNKTECDLLFAKSDTTIDPLSAAGGGVVDVAAFALRVASWSMQNPRSRNTIIMDEPMRFLSRDLQEKASMMLKEISEKLGLQFIIITHEPTLTSYADKVFTVTNKKGVSNVVAQEGGAE